MLVPAFAGVLLFGEALTFTLAAAVALFLAAFWCLNVAPGGAQKPEPRWLALCALTFLCNGLCAVVQKLSLIHIYWRRSHSYRAG